MNGSNRSDLIPLSILIEYHRMGFKLIPISNDGVIPNVKDLLTPEERRKSIEESKSGKEEPVNYIHNHPEFWTEERIEREAHRFNNVATTYGKTHLKDEEGRDLYLNELDIDDKEIFTRLSIVNVNGKEYSFLDEIGKGTFGVKTRKEWGRRYYWLSHQQNKPVRSNDCKVGHRFEIKTDNSTGHGTLPPSRYRNDAMKHYQSIGQSEIVVRDGMYDGLLKILNDCLKKNYNRSNSENKNQHQRESSDQNENSNQDTEYIEFTLQSMAESLKPLYKEGYRHYIIVGLVGLSHKYNLQKEYTSKIMEILTINDEERVNRFRILDETYNKDPKEVSGYTYFLSVLESASGNHRIAVDILHIILVALDGIIRHDEDIDDVVSLTHKLMEEFVFKTMRDAEEIYYYDVDKEVYVPYGKCLIEEQLELLCPDISTHKVQEVIQKIRRRTFTNRDDFDSNEEIINVQNGLLDIHTGDLKDYSSDFLSTIQLPIKYNPSAKCPNILKFLSQVLHPQDIFTAMEVIGYVLLKSNKYEKAFMLFGLGDNGKSVFIKLIESFVGPQNTSHVTLQDLEGDRFSSADLYGKLVNTFADLKATKLSSTGTFKTLVSGDSIRAQYKYGQPFSFVSHAKLVFSANRIPDSDDTSHAYFKRWLILAFEKSFMDGTKDTNLIHKLTTSEELSGLLNLALVALRQLEKDGGFRDIPVEEVKRDYERKSNTVKAFLADMCHIDLGAPDYVTPSGKIYDEYTEYCKQRKERPLDANIFGMELKKVGIEKDRLRNHGIREYHYLGVQLLSNLRGQNQSLL